MSGKVALAVAFTVGLSAEPAHAEGRPGDGGGRCPPRRGEPVGPPIGPWVSDVGPRSLTIRWEEGHPGVAAVRMGGPDGRLVVGPPAVRLSQRRERWRGPPAPVGWLYAVTVDQLEPSTRYEYVIECGALAGRRATVATAPRPGEAFTFVGMGDSRTRHDDHRLVVRTMARFSPDLVVNTGDIVEVGFPEEWQAFFGIEASLVASVPVLVAFGNHEAYAGERMYDAYFPCQEPGPGGSRSCTYAYGSMRVVLLDTEATLDQVAWVRTLLAGRRSELVVVVLHRPLYTFSRHRPRLDWRQLLHPVLVDADVELVLQGHNHVYERFVVEGVTYVTTGGAGAPRYHLDGNYDESEAGLRKAADNRLHFVVGRVAAARADLEAVDARTGAVFDRFSVR